MDDESPLGALFALLIPGVLLAVPVWVIAVVVKAVSVALPGRRPDWPQDLLRWGAWMAGSAAVIVYLLGAGTVAFSVHEASSGADSTPAYECRDDVPAGRLVGQTASWVPLRFDCVLDDGSTVPSSPAYFWINTLVVGLVLAAVACGVMSGTVSEGRPEPHAPSTEPGPTDVSGPA
ncbi:hypothetical protein [Streptomyces sp. NPDC006193]|uniref:hypothetical protein n=1 Tax=Streptomyces sp. NPDC006193 TaxID=3155717 RepID=UPI0033A30E04